MPSQEVACSEKPKPFKYKAQIEMLDAKQATIVARSVDVDPELRPEEVTRSIRVEGNAFVIEVAASDAKTLRTAVTSLYDFIRVSLLAVAEFDS